MRALSPACSGSRAGCFPAGDTPAATGWDFAAARTSVSVTRPSGPVPFTLKRSTPSSDAIRRATGDAFTRGCSCSRPIGSGFCCFSSSRAADTAPSPCFCCGGAISSCSARAGAGFSVSACGLFFFSPAESGSFPFFCADASCAGASSPSPRMNAILSPTFTFPPSCT